MYGAVYHAREGLPRITATFKGVGHRRNATGHTFRIAPQVSQMHIALAQHLFVLSIRADEFFNLAALTFIKRMLRVAEHVLQFLDALFHIVKPHHLEFHLQLFCVHAVQFCGLGIHFGQACHAVQCLPFLLQRHNGCPDAADFLA